MQCEPHFQRPRRHTHTDTYINTHTHTCTCAAAFATPSSNRAVQICNTWEHQSLERVEHGFCNACMVTYARTVIHKFRANDDATARTCATARDCLIQPRCTDVELGLALGCGTWEFDFMVKLLDRALHRCGPHWLPQRQISNARVPQTRNCLRHARGRNVEP